MLGPVLGQVRAPALEPAGPAAEDDGSAARSTGRSGVHAAQASAPDTSSAATRDRPSPGRSRGHSAKALGRRQPRSNGSRQEWGTTSWWMALGPQLPGE